LSPVFWLRLEKQGFSFFAAFPLMTAANSHRQAGILREVGVAERKLTLQESRSLIRFNAVSVHAIGTKPGPSSVKALLGNLHKFLVE
jgi:hypothetical protein